METIISSTMQSATDPMTTAIDPATIVTTDDSVIANPSETSTSKAKTIVTTSAMIGGGITGGYKLPLNRALSLDFSLGLGYLHATYDKYNVIDNVRVRAGHDRKNWFGPVSAGVTLVWKIF